MFFVLDINFKSYSTLPIRYTELRVLEDAGRIGLSVQNNHITFYKQVSKKYGVMSRENDIWGEIAVNFEPKMDIDRLEFGEVNSWLIEALDTRYPDNRKKSFEMLFNLSWAQIRLWITSSIESRDYVKIHELKNMLSIDLLNTYFIKKTGLFIEGTLGILKGGSIEGLTTLMVLNERIRDPKIEAYIVYRLLGGRPRIVKYTTFRKI